MIETRLPKIEDSGAEFSPCRTWRYSLWRSWDTRPLVAFIGLNPSTADEIRNDRTVRRCMGFAHAWGFGGLLMLNAYAFRATKPAAMKAAADPVGPDHDERLRNSRAFAAEFVAAWGNHCDQARAARVCQLIGRRIDCLGTTSSGAPRHPLYLKATTARKAFYSPRG